MDNIFYDFTLNINKLNKLFMQTIDLKLKNNAVYDINPHQALLIINIGKKTGHVHETNTGYYLGTNNSYNAKNLVQKGYIEKIHDTSDNRCFFLVLTPKGFEILRILEGVFLSRSENLQSLKIDVKNINEILLRLQTIF